MRCLILLLLCSPLLSTSSTAQTSAPVSSIFWEISGPKLTKPSYLLGSIHIPDKRVFAYDSVVWKAFTAADALVVEVKIDEVDPMVMLQRMMDPLIDYKSLLREDYAVFEKTLQSIPQFPQEMLLQLRPFFLFSLLSQSVIPNDMEAPLDLHFLKEARRMKKTVFEVESFEEQMEAVAKVPDAEWIQEMRSILRDSLVEKSLEAEYAKLLNNYLREDSEAFWQQMLDEQDEKPYFMEYFILKRNERMMQKILDLMDQNSLFVLVGAGHLGGPFGIVEQLKKAGYRLRPLSAGLKKD